MAEDRRRFFFFRFDYNFNPMPDTSPILFKLYLPIFRDSSIFVPNGPLFFRVVSIQNFSTPRWTVEEKETRSMENSRLLVFFDY